MDLTAGGVAGSLRLLSDVLHAIEEEAGYWHHLAAGVGITLQKWEEAHDGFGSLLRQEDRKKNHRLELKTCI
jgi:hypothetical protein